MHRYAIINQDETVIKQIKDIIETIYQQYHLELSITEYLDPDQFNFKENYHALFLDVKMGDINGIELAKQYLNSHYDSQIIFISDYSELVFLTFIVHPFDFLTKNNLNTHLKQTINDLIKKLEKINPQILIKTKNEYHSINLSDIIYCQNQKHLCFIHTTKNIIKTRYQLKELISMINSKHFFMISQSYLVNWKYVTKIADHQAILNNGTILPISKRRYKEALTTFQRYHLIK